MANEGGVHFEDEMAPFGLQDFEKVRSHLANSTGGPVAYPPDNTRLVNVVWEALVPTPDDAYAAGDGPSVEDVLNAVPSGWAKLNGEWLQLEHIGQDPMDSNVYTLRRP